MCKCVYNSLKILICSAYQNCEPMSTFYFAYTEPVLGGVRAANTKNHSMFTAITDHCVIRGAAESTSFSLRLFVHLASKLLTMLKGSVEK